MCFTDVLRRVTVVARSSLRDTMENTRRLVSCETSVCTLGCWKGIHIGTYIIICHRRSRFLGNWMCQTRHAGCLREKYRLPELDTSQHSKRDLLSWQLAEFEVCLMINGRNNDKNNGIDVNVEANTEGNKCSGNIKYFNQRWDVAEATMAYVQRVPLCSNIGGTYPHAIEKRASNKTIIERSTCNRKLRPFINKYCR